MKRTWGVVLAGMICLAWAWAPAAAPALPANFTDSTVFSGLRLPISVAFAPDGRIFVAEKGGTIEVFDGPSDTTPTRFADLRTEIFGGWDRGLESIAIDPQFPARPYLYASYTYDAPIGGTAPTWGVPGQDDDDCPGATSVGCVVSGRLSRLTVANGGAGNAMSNERVLINDWCQQFTSHSVGDLGFDAAGNLYMSGGDGAEYNTHDYGQFGQPSNPCGDPPGGVGGTQTAATGEGGALRSQDYRTTGDPLGLDGTIIRVNPDTGRPVPDVVGNDPSTLNTARVVAFGFRNPFRFAIRPGTSPAEVWAGDVGWGTWEEINRVQTQAGAASNNFGWPCVEGAAFRVYYQAGFCQSLYAAGGDKAPYYGFQHGTVVDPAETSLQPRPCIVNSGSAISGLEFYDDGTGAAAFPAAYDGSLFFADYARGCIWVMRAGTNGLPNPADVKVFDGAGGPVDLEVAPDGSLWYVGITTGEVHRVAYGGGGNRPPVARVTATPDHGSAPLRVQLDASASSDPDAGDQLSYAWDLDGDGAFDDSTAANPTRTYTTEGIYRPRVRVSDRAGASSQADVAVSVGAPPTPVITSPAAGVQFDANQMINFSGSAGDAKDGQIPASGLRWTAVLNHCIVGGGCHQHPIRTFNGVAGGQFAMPVHERPYHLTLTLTARDSDGLEASVSRDIYPKPNVAPVARATATPDHGEAPLRVDLDASGSTDANPGDQLSYAWDLDGDGAFDDSTAVSPTKTYATAGTYRARVEVTDRENASSQDDVTVDVTAHVNAPPAPQIDLPAEGTSFAANQRIPFSGSASDPEDGALPASGLKWRLVGPDCQGDGCAGQLLVDGADHGELVAPARVDPYELRLRLIATDSNGASAATEVVLEPRVARLTVRSGRDGARASIAGERGQVPVVRTVLQGAAVRVATPALQHAPGRGAKAKLEWRRWSDGGDRVHDVRLDADAVLRASYGIVRKPPAPPG